VIQGAWGNFHPNRRATLFKQFRVRPCSGKDNLADLVAVIKPVYQQKIAANMTFAMALPLTRQMVIAPLRAKLLLCYQPQHYFLEPVHVVPA
jgi:hypothetical protein